MDSLKRVRAQQGTGRKEFDPASIAEVWMIDLHGVDFRCS